MLPSECMALLFLNLLIFIYIFCTVGDSVDLHTYCILPDRGQKNEGKNKECMKNSRKMKNRNNPEKNSDTRIWPCKETHKQARF